MEKVTLKQNSWHYKMVNKMTTWRPSRFDQKLEKWVQNDFCSYIRAACYALFIIVLFAFGATVLYSSLVKISLESWVGVIGEYPILHWIVSIITPVAFIAACVGVIFLWLLFYTWACESKDRMFTAFNKVLKRKNDTTKVKEPSMIAQAYASIKGKYCLGITVKKE